MKDTNLFVLLLGVLIYGSGFLLWPVRRWLCRKQKIRGKALGFAFLAQLLAYVTVCGLSSFVRLGHFYYWFIFAIELNILFTIAGVFAWIRDSDFERRIATGNTGEPDKGADQSTNQTTRKSGWALFCRIGLCSLGTYFMGASLHHYFSQDLQWPPGVIVAAVLGLLLVCSGLFTSDKMCERIAESL